MNKTKSKDLGLFYVTTPIYYVNDKPHLGTAYSTIVADIFNRYHLLFGEETFFLTGTDEHGQKCEQVAKEQGQDIQTHCDQMSENFKQVWQALHIDYDFFLRTSSKAHKQGVQKALQILYDKGDIYSSIYKGWYCVSEEIFYTEKDLVDGRSPSGKEVTYIEEKNYFFKMSHYASALKKHLEQHPLFIQPSFRQNEIKGFLKQPLQDLCISRPKSRVSWGVELPFDSQYVSYVWVDALLNYLTGIGCFQEDKKFKKWWFEAGATHFLGKDILMTHGVYWPCILMALDLPLPKTLFAHGWLLNDSDQKMSKSKGQKLDPLELAEQLGVSELRYFLAREISLGQDARISPSLLEQKINQDLSSLLGNHLSRLSRLLEKHYKGELTFVKSKQGEVFQKQAEQTCQKVKESIQHCKLHQALEAIHELLSSLNPYLEKQAPWNLVKTDKEQALIVLYNGLEVLRICGILLYPVMPQKMQELLDIFGEKPKWSHLSWGRLPLNKQIKLTTPLFPRRQLSL